MPNFILDGHFTCRRFAKIAEFGPKRKIKILGQDLQSLQLTEQTFWYTSTLLHKATEFQVKLCLWTVACSFKAEFPILAAEFGNTFFDRISECQKVAKCLHFFYADIYMYLSGWWRCRCRSRCRFWSEFRGMNNRCRFGGSISRVRLMGIWWSISSRVVLTWNRQTKPFVKKNLNIHNEPLTMYWKILKAISIK